MTIIDKIYMELYPRIKDLLLTYPGRISFTHDMWTSPNQLAFMAVTCDFITADWEPNRITVGFEHVQGSHSAEVIYEAFVSLLSNQWDLHMDRVFDVTLDNAAVNTRFLQLLEQRQDFERGHGFRYLAHVINLDVNKLLDQQACNAVAERVRAIARYVRAQGSAQRL